MAYPHLGKPLGHFLGAEADAFTVTAVCGEELQAALLVVRNDSFEETTAGSWLTKEVSEELAAATSTHGHNPWLTSLVVLGADPAKVQLLQYRFDWSWRRITDC